MIGREVVLNKKVGTEVVGRVAPHAVHVVGIVLGIVELDEGDRALDTEVVGLVNSCATGPGEMQLSDSTGGRYAVHLGIEPGDRVALYAANSLDWAAAYLGTLRAGAVVVGMNPAYRSAEAEHILTDSAPAAVIADAERAPLAAAFAARTIPLEDLPTGEPPQQPQLGPDSPALLLYTSGTTGRPKGALLDHGNLLAQARGVVSSGAADLSSQSPDFMPSGARNEIWLGS